MTSTVAVTVPESWKLGQPLLVSLPDGSKVRVTPPNGTKPGQSVDVCIPSAAIPVAVRVVASVDGILLPSKDIQPGHKEWDVGIWGCLSMQESGCCCCLNHCCCGYCVFASAMSKSGIAQEFLGLQRDQECLANLAVFGGLCCELFPCQGRVGMTVARIEIAKKYGIHEDWLYSGLCAFCCFPCSICQTTNEIVHREDLTY